MRLWRRTPNTFNLADQRSPVWRHRAEVAVALMEETGFGASRIADLGCGDRKVLHVLKERLQQDFSYQGYDLLPQHKDVIQIDFNRTFPEGRYDWAFCLGLLEYIEDLGPFFDRLHRMTQHAIISYVASDSGFYSNATRHAMGWLHNYSSRDIVTCFNEHGFGELGRKVILNGKTYVFAMKSQED